MDTITSWITRVTTALAALTKRTGAQESTSATHPPRDFTQERETDRVSNLGEEDRSWETATLQRHQDARERNQPPGTG